MFVHDPRRDASPTIRGFVYQVNLTIQRWLGLGENEALELESGEDIDIVARSLETGEEEARILEQVKDWSAPLTLRSAAAVESVANFALHRECNPDLRLCFRFTTTAPIGREQGAAFPSHEPGIVVWQRLQNREGGKAGDRDTASALRAFYTELHRPNKTRADAWTALRRVVEQASDEQWMDFLTSFEWSTGNDQLTNVDTAIRRDLIRLGFAADNTLATERHGTLFVYAIRLLCTGGEKRLTYSGLATALRGARDSNLERRVTSLFERFSQLETRVDVIETNIASVTLRQSLSTLEIADFGERLRVVEHRVESAASFSDAAFSERFLRAEGVKAAPLVGGRTTVVMESVPPPPARAARRFQTVTALHAEVAGRTWTAVLGEAEAGKTQLAVLIAKRWGKVHWFSSPSLSSPEALELRLRSIADGDDESLFRAVVLTVPQGTLFVFDDLPELGSRDPRSVLLRDLAVAGRDRIHFLSLSTQAPRLIRDVLGDRFASLTVPPFSNEEARDLFLLYGAPPQLSDRAVEFLNALAQGNPTLLTALSRYLHSRMWQISEEGLNLLSGVHLGEIGRELMMRLRNDVQETATRELFSRTRLARRGLTLEDIRSLAEVDPAIDRIPERLIDLDGLWLRRESTDRYEPTPLAKALPAGDLQRATERCCHVVLAERIVGAGPMDRDAIMDVVYHYMEAKEFNLAGRLFAQALARIVQDEAWHEMILPGMYTATALPSAMALHLRLYIRTQQLKIARKLGGYPRPLLQEGLRLVQEATTDDAALVANFVTEVAFEDTGDSESWSVAMDALLRLTELQPNAEDLSFMGQSLSDQTWAMLFYMVGRTVRTVTDVDRWTEAADQLPEARRQQILATAFDRQSLVNAAWLRVAKNAHPPWTDVLAVHRRWRAWAERNGDALLWAYAIRAEVIVRAEYLNECDDALAFANEALGRANSAHERFILNETIATQLRRVRRYEEAERSYDAAFADFDAATHTEQVYALHLASSVVASHDPARAAKLLERGGEIIRNAVNEFDPIRLAIVSADLGLAYWHSGRLGDAFNEWDTVASRLIDDASLDEGSRRGLIALLLTVLQQFSNIFNRTEFAENERAVVGTFDRNIVALAEYWKPAQTALLATALTLIAEKVGRKDRAFVWIDHAVAAARELNDPIVTAFVAMEALPCALARNNFANALRFILELCGPGEDPTKPGDGVLAQYIFVVAFQFCALMLTNLQLARNEMSSISDALREVAGEPDAAILADLLAAASHSDNTDEMNAFAAQTPPGTALWAIALLLQASSSGRSTIARATYHATIAPQVVARASFWNGMYASVVLSYFEAFWQREASVNAFRFSAPLSFRRELEQTHTLPPHQRLQRVLEIVCDGLGMSLPREFRDWLRNAR